MKNYSIFIYVILFVLRTNVFAQQTKFETGIEGGPGLSHFSGNDVDYSTKLVFSSGIAFQYNFPKLFSIRSGLLFERKGENSKGIFLDVNGAPIGEFKSEVDLNYITLPVLLRSSFGKKTRFFAQLGPYISYLTKATLHYNGPNVSRQLVADIDRFYYKLDLGATGGIGVSLPATKSVLLSFEIRENFGIYNIATPVPFIEYYAYNRSLNFLAGIAYTFGTSSETKK